MHRRILHGLGLQPEIAFKKRCRRILRSLQARVFKDPDFEFGDSCVEVWDGGMGDRNKMGMYRGRGRSVGKRFRGCSPCNDCPQIANDGAA